MKKLLPFLWWLACTLAMAQPAISTSAADAGQTGASVLAASKMSHAAYLRVVKSRLTTPAAKIGRIYQGPFCHPVDELLWNEDLVRSLSHRLPKIFRHELELAHYPVPPLSATLDYAVDANVHRYVEIDMSIENALAELCLQDDGLSGWVSLRIHWQVYYAGMPAVLHENTTEATYQTAMIENATTTQLFEKAFSIAAKKFLTDSHLLQAAKGALPP